MKGKALDQERIAMELDREEIKIIEARRAKLLKKTQWELYRKLDHKTLTLEKLELKSPSLVITLVLAKDHNNLWAAWEEWTDLYYDGYRAEKDYHKELLYVGNNPQEAVAAANCRYLERNNSGYSSEAQGFKIEEQLAIKII